MNVKGRWGVGCKRGKSDASRSLVVDCKNSLEIFHLVLREHFLLMPADEEGYDKQQQNPRDIVLFNMFFQIFSFFYFYFFLFFHRVAQGELTWNTWSREISVVSSCSWIPSSDHDRKIDLGSQWLGITEDTRWKVMEDDFERFIPLTQENDFKV